MDPRKFKGPFIHKERIWQETVHMRATHTGESSHEKS